MLGIIRFYIEKKRIKSSSVDMFSGEVQLSNERKCFNTYYLVVAVAVIIVILNSFEGLGAVYNSILILFNGVKAKT